MADRETDRLAAIKARAERATPGPWEDGPPAWYRGRTNPEHGKRPITAGAEGTLANVYGAGNASFIAHARADVPYLLARVAAIREAQMEETRAACHFQEERDRFRARVAALEAERADMEARKDAAYEERNRVVAALARCFPSGVARTAIEGWSDDWHGCVYIDLPTGQVSWHYHDSQAHLFEGLPAYTGTWDGHTTDEKYQRVAALRDTRLTPAQVRERIEKAWDDLVHPDDVLALFPDQEEKK